MEHITVSNIEIEIVRKNIKNIVLTMYPPKGRVRISAPLQAKSDTIRLFVVSKLAWIKQNQRKYEGQERLSTREYKDRESHYFQGQRYLLNVIEVDAPPKVVLRSKTYIDLYVRPATPTAKRHEIMNEWYRAQLKAQIPELIEKWEQRLNVQVGDWQIKLMKTKWGSCNVQKKRIWLNLELAKKPLHCLEYVIVHEMAHFFERHHNDKFHSYLDQFLPNWKQVKTELNKLPLSYAEWNY